MPKYHHENPQLSISKWDITQCKAFYETDHVVALNYDTWNLAVLQRIPFAADSRP
jgi:hypothetical protein